MTENEFVEELKKINIEISSEQLKQLRRYYELLIEWNSKINLTRIIKQEDVYLKHFYDSLTVARIIDLKSINNVCDIGTGAGFPGIVLKIVYPHLKITLVDSLNKRINFLNIVIKELNLSNIYTIHSRIEEYGKNKREEYDLVVSRAVAKINILLEYASPLIKVDKYFVAMKGNLEEELEKSTKACKILNLQILKIEKFLLPNEESIRNIVLFKKIAETNKKYPRNFDEIKKRPL